MRSKALFISALMLLSAFFPQLRAEPVIESGAVTEPRALIDLCGILTICPGFPCLCLWPLDWCSFLTCNWFDICGCGFPQWCNACSGCNIGLIGALGNPCSLFNLGLLGDCLNPCSLCNLGIFLGNCLNPCSGINMGFFAYLGNLNPCSCLNVFSCANLWSCGCSDIPPIPSFSLCNWLPCCWGVGETWAMALSCLSSVPLLSYISSTITFASSRLFLILQTIAAYCGISELL